MKDAFDEELKKGDPVVYVCVTQACTVLKLKSEVVGFTPKCVRLANGRLVQSHNLIRLIA